MAKARVKVTRTSVVTKSRVKKNKKQNKSGNPNRCAKCGRFI